MREHYTHIKRARSAFMARKATVHGSNGQELHDQQAIRDQRKEYTEKLYESEHQNHPAEENEPSEPELELDILKEEVVREMKQLANRKVPEIDGIPPELLRPIPAATLTAL